MNMKCRVLVCLFMLAAAQSGRAQTITTIFTGVVGANTSPSPDIDTLGLFGPAGASLNGKKMQFTLKFDASLLEEGGMSPGYSGWSGPSGSCAVKIGGKAAKPSIESLTGINSSRVYLYSDYQGVWELTQFAQSSSLPNVCGVTASSTKHEFVPGVVLVEAFGYKPPRVEQDTDSFYFDITVNGVREVVSANVKSLSYGE